MVRTVLSFLVLGLLVGLAPPAFADKDAPNSVFLVARDGLPDPNFRKAVVLVTQPSQGGPFGVIINRPSELRLSKVFAEYETLKDRKDVLYFGGPVKPQGLVFLVRTKKHPPRGMSVMKGVYFTGDNELIETLLHRQNPTEGLRVFAGYSGWGVGQLQREIARGDWYIVPASAATVFEKDPKQIWPELIKRAGARRTGYTAGFSAADERRYTQIIRLLNRRDAESAEYFIQESQGFLGLVTGHGSLVTVGMPPMDADKRR